MSPAKGQTTPLVDRFWSKVGLEPAQVPNLCSGLSEDLQPEAGGMTLARNKRRGAETEIAVAEHAKARGFCHSHRRTRTGVKDCGDVFVSELVQSAEVKATKTLDSAGFLREARTEAEHAGSPIPVAIWRPPGKGTASVGQFVALLTYDDLLNLLAEASTPTEHDVLWRSLWSRAADDVVTLVEFIRENGLEPPFVHTERVKEEVAL